jgi:hypothetical protein
MSSPEQNRAHYLRRREAAIAAGLCFSCRTNKAVGKLRCQDCAKNVKRSVRSNEKRREKRREEYKAARVGGYCIVCGKTCTRYAMCLDHRREAAEKQVKVRERAKRRKEASAGGGKENESNFNPQSVPAV